MENSQISKYKKLELCWVGKDIQIKPEPRVLIENHEKSYGSQNTENMLIHADNLLALKALEQKFTGKIKCICIDPPYNTGSAFEYYDDGLEHSMWLNLMRPRIELLYKLLSKDGSIWINIDDNEVHYLKILCDEIFGRNNFLTTICVKMSHLSGVKMSHVEKKPPKIKEYIIVFAKNKELFTIKPAFEKVEWKDALERYNQFIINKEDDYKKWKVIPIKQAALNYKINTKDKEEFENFLIENADKIFRTARNRAFEITGIKNTFTKIETKRGLQKLVYNDEEVLFASEKMIEIDGKFLPVNILGDIWLDIGINNLHNEGGVDFRNGKKPEKVISRIIEMTTNEGDWVLDSFLGSGTTAAVAHKMGRKYIGIELGEHCNTHCLPRLKMVCDGTDQGGISKAVNWQGGGGFKFYELAPSLLNKDKYGQYVINPKYNAQLLAAAMAKHEGYTYQPHETMVWKQGFSSENNFIFTTTNHITPDIINQIVSELKPNESLRICCITYDIDNLDDYPQITIKQIPELLLGRCEFDNDDYSFNTIVTMPIDKDKPEFTPSYIQKEDKIVTAKIDKNAGNLKLF